MLKNRIMTEYYLPEIKNPRWQVKNAKDSKSSNEIQERRIQNAEYYEESHDNDSRKCWAKAKKINYK